MDQKDFTSFLWTIVAIAAVFYFMNMFVSSKESYENQEDGTITQIDDIKQKVQQKPVQQAIAQQAVAQQAVAQQKPVQQAVAQQAVAQQAVAQQAVAQQADAMNITLGDKELTSADLLPTDNGFASWGDAAPQGSELEGRNFLESGHHFGINTVGQSLRNANLQLRSDPSIPQVDVGPWLQSTIDQDTNRRQFEVGGDY